VQENVFVGHKELKGNPSFYLFYFLFLILFVTFFFFPFSFLLFFVQKLDEANSKSREPKSEYICF